MVKKILLTFIFVLGTTNFAQMFSDSLEIQIKQFDSPSEQITFLNNLSDKLRKVSKLTEAEIASKRAIELVEKHNLIDKYSKSYSYLGLIYRDKSEYNLAQECFKKAIKVAKQLNQKLQIAYGYNNLATIDRILSNYPAAIKNIFKSLSIFNELNNEKGISHCQVNLGILFRYLKEYEKSLEHLETAVKIREKTNNTRGLAQAKYLIAETYFESGKYETALKFYEEARKIYKNANVSSDFIKTTLSMAFGGTYYELKDYKKALQYRLKALELIKKSDDKNNLARVYLALGKIYLKLGNYALSSKNLNKALYYANLLSLKSRQLEIYEMMATLYKTWNKPEAAYNSLKKYADLKDSIYSDKSKELIAKLESEFKVKEEERRNELLSAKLEIASQKSFYFLITSLLSISLLILFIILLKNTKKKNQLLREINNTKDLFFSIIAHDVKNPFGTILNTTDFLINEKDLLDENEKDKLIENIGSSSKRVFELLDNLLKWSRSQKGLLRLNPTPLNLRDLVENIIILLKNNADAKNIEIRNNISDSIKVLADENTISLVVRNLLNNAIKFCEDGIIEFGAYIKKDFVFVEVRDNGIGIEPERINGIFSIQTSTTTVGTSGEKGSGLGLILCKEFVEKNGGQISVTSKKGEGSKFTFSLKLVK